MGTNYYLRTYLGEQCPKCGRSDDLEVLHIGKSSAGWAFCFNPHYNRFNSFKDWRVLLEQNPNSIFDEYKRQVPLFEFYELVNSKKDCLFGKSDKRDQEGFRVSDSSDFS